MMEEIPTKDWDSKEERNAQAVRMAPVPVAPAMKKIATSTAHRAPIGGPAPLASVGKPQEPLNQPAGKMAPHVGAAPAAAAPQPVLPIAQPAAKPATMGDLNGAVNRINEQLATLKELQAQGSDDSGIGMYRTPDVPSVVYSSSGFPFGADHPWGLVSVGGTSVTIADGEFEAGNGAYFATAQQTFTIGSDASYIGLQYDPNAGSLTLIAPTTSKPVSGDGVFRTWLYFFSFDGSNAHYVKHNLTAAHAAIYAYEPA